ncbi:MAG TPA: class I SAM-dependent methyltransferase [Thermomicrobiales bacterium]|nr:class I SAM-dependent methyltransferase [Thermomicrobiales bacterium]
MTADPNAGWDRAADLESVKVAYARYADSGRTNLWNERNPGYARLANELSDELIRNLRESMSPGETRVLDLGCGTGDLARLRPALGGPTDWVGIDLRVDAIDTALRAYPDARFIVASADEVPEPDACFDVAVAQLLFSSLPSTQLEQAVAREVRRILRPGGWLLWVDLRYSNPWNPDVHGLPISRIRSLFPGWEMDIRAAGLMPPIARRLGRAARILYPLLSSLPPLRSHYIGRLRRPTLTD